MKTIKLSETDIAVGKKVEKNLPPGTDMLLGHIDYSYVKLRFTGTQRAIFFVFEISTQPLTALFNGHPNLYAINQIVEGHICILNQSDGLHVVNKREVNSTIQVSYF